MTRTKPWTQEEISFATSNYSCMSAAQIGARIGRTAGSVRLKMKSLGCKSYTFSDQPTIQSIPSPNRDASEILADQAARFREKRDRWEVKHDGIRIEIPGNKPYALVLCGDPHVDDDGCDIEKLAYDMEFIATTPGVYGCTVGDLTNNWLRALGHLYGKQHTTDEEAITLMEWFVGYLPWLWVVLGNHDKWGPAAKMACRSAGVQSVSHGAIFKLITGAGTEDERTMKVDCRHTHKGNSQYAQNFAQVKMNYRGSDADVIVGGHTHASAYSLVMNGVSGKMAHCLRIGAYKKYDEYADQSNFSEDFISPSVMLVVDPGASPEGFIHAFHDLDQGAKFLAALQA